MADGKCLPFASYTSEQNVRSLTPRCSHYECSLGVRGEAGRGDSVSGVTAWARHLGTRTPHPAWGQSDPDTAHVWDDATD